MLMGANGGPTTPNRKLLILLALQGWLTALDDFRDWLVQQKGFGSSVESQWPLTVW